MNDANPRPMPIHADTLPPTPERRVSSIRSWAAAHRHQASFPVACAVCGSTFTAHRLTAKLCSDRCRKRAQRAGR